GGRWGLPPPPDEGGPTHRQGRRPGPARLPRPAERGRGRRVHRPRRPGPRSMSPRRLRLYGVGMGKSGTHSLAAVFERDYRAAHEPDAKELMELLFDVWAGVRPWSAVAQLLQDRDARLDLEVDASLVNGEVVSDLVALWPEGRFG